MCRVNDVPHRGLGFEDEGIGNGGLGFRAGGLPWRREGEGEGESEDVGL